MNLSGKSSKVNLNNLLNKASSSSTSSSTSTASNPNPNPTSSHSNVSRSPTNKEYSFLSLDDNLSSPTSSSSSNSTSSRLNAQRSQPDLTAAAASRSHPHLQDPSSTSASIISGMPQSQQIGFSSLDSQLISGGMDGSGNKDKDRLNHSNANHQFNSTSDPDTPVSPTGSSKNKNTRGSRLGAQMGRKGAISPSLASPPPSSSTTTTTAINHHQSQPHHPPSSSSTPTSDQQQRQSSSSSSSSSQDPISIGNPQSSTNRTRSPSHHLPNVTSTTTTGLRSLSTGGGGSTTDLKGKWKEREQRDLMEESAILERERTIRDQANTRVKGWARAQGGQGMELEGEEYLKEGPSPKDLGNGGRFQSPGYSNTGGGSGGIGRVAAMAAKLAGNASSSSSSSDLNSTPPRLGAAMGMRNASSTSNTSSVNSNPTSTSGSASTSNLNSNNPPPSESINIRREPTRSPTWDRQSGSSFGTAITSDDWTSGPGNHLSINSNHSLSGSNENGLTTQTLAAFSSASSPSNQQQSSSPSPSPTYLSGPRRLSRTSSSGNLLSDSTTAAGGGGATGDSSFGSQASQGTSRGGRLGRLQYNKSDNISVSGPSNKGWDSRRPSAESRTSLLGRASTPNLASSFRKDESTDRSTRKNSGDSQASGNGGGGSGSTGGSNFDWKNPFTKSNSPRGSNAGMSDQMEYNNNNPSNPTSPSSNPPSSYRGSFSSTSNSTSAGPPQQRELLLPALSGVRSAIADLVGPASPLWINDSKNQSSNSPADVLAHAREDLQSGGTADGTNHHHHSESVGSGIGNTTQRGSQDLGGSSSSVARSSIQSQDRGGYRRPPSTTGSDTSGSASKPNSQGGGPHETLTRFAMSVSPLLDSLDSTVGSSVMETSYNSNEPTLTQDATIRNPIGTQRPSGQPQRTNPSSVAGSISAASSPVFSQDGRVGSGIGIGRDPQDSPSLGQLSDEAIVRLGALPGTSPENLLNPNGTPLSSKNVLTIALKKAQNAVGLDSANNVPEAIIAYQQAVRLLREVMERIAPRNGKKSKASREEERRRLKNIHDTYAERIRLLSMIYSPDENDNDSDFDREGEELDQGDDSRFNANYNSSSSHIEGSRPGWNDQSFSDDPSMSGAADSSTSFFASRSSNNSFSRDHQSQTQQHQKQQNQSMPRSRSRDVMEELVDSDSESYNNPNRNASRASTSDLSALDSRKDSNTSEEFNAPAISIQPDSPRKNPENQKEVLQEGVRQNRSDSESSFSSVQSNRGFVQNGITTRNFDVSPDLDSLANFQPQSQPQPQSLLGVSRFGKTSNGLEDELRTPTTPFFDVDPNLGMEHESSAPQSKFESSSINDTTKQSSTPTSSTSTSAHLPPTAFRDPFRREEHSRNAGSLSNVPDLKSLLPARPSYHRRSSSASSANHSVGGGSQTGSVHVRTPTAAKNTTSFPSKQPPPESQSQTQPQQESQVAEIAAVPHKPSALKHTSIQASQNPVLLVSPTTSSGTISQRRNKYHQGPSSDSSDASISNATGAHPKLVGLQTRYGRSDSSPSVPSRLVASQEASARAPSPQEEKNRRDTTLQSPQVSPGGGSTGRQRAASQPGSKRPAIPAAFMNNSSSGNANQAAEVVPPVPRMSRKASMPSSLSPAKTPEVQLPRQGAPSQPGHFRFPSPTPAGLDPSSGPFLAEPFSQTEREKALPTPRAIMNDLFPGGLLSSSSGIPSFATSPSTSILPKLAITTVIPDSISSSTPSVLPNQTVLRPFYLMNQLSVSIQKGGYVTPRLFVSKSLWSQSGARLTAIESKVRMMELVSSGIDGIEQAGKTLLLTPSGQPGLAMIQAAKFAKGLEELETLLVEVQNTLAKKLDFLKSVTGKKSNSSFGSIGSKLTRSLDRMTNGSKNLDSPTTYVDGLARLFSRTKILESHLQLLIKSQSSSSVSDDSDVNGPSIEAYAALPKDLRSSIETKLKKSSDFFANVVLAFVIKDLGILLDKSVKRNGVAIAE